jgi:hypothetical protein
VTEPDGSWGWLEQAAQEAREIIERLYTEGRSELADQAGTPAKEGWPGQLPSTS